MVPAASVSIRKSIYSWFFFFSSRRRHTRCSRDWSSDVCSSDLFSRAAGALFITPSGLSVLIRELETQLGFRLFDRTTRHVAPTAYGTEFLGVARRCLADLDAATARIGRSATHAGQIGQTSPGNTKKQIGRAHV